MTERMPEPTANLNIAASQLREQGVTVLQDALTSQQLARAKSSLEELASRERANGGAFLESGRGTGRAEDDAPGSNQRLLGLIGKGEIFGELAQLRRPLSLIEDAFGRSYDLPLEATSEFDLADVLISSVTANIAVRGGSPQDPHTDQGFAPACTTYPLVMNVVFMIDEFTKSNGATLLAPGSHLVSTSNHYADPPERAPARGPAGSALIFDGRIWHGTGENKTGKSRTGLLVTYCRPFVRQFENLSLTLSESVARGMSKELLSMLGFKVWMLLGATNGERHGTMIR